MAKKAAPKGDQVELHYLGNEAGEPHLDGIPATDLTADQLDALVTQRDGIEAGADGFDEARAALVDYLTASGLYGAEEAD